MILSANDLYKNYKTKEVLKGISFEIGKGEIIGLLGPNGTGKTTLIKLLCDINKPTKGTVEYKEDSRIAVVFDYNGLYENFTAIENLRLFSEKYSEEAIEKSLRTVGLWEVRNKRVKTYSKGMQRKLTIARALMKNPTILILDEPFDGLDVESRNYWIEFLKEWVAKDRTIIISSHIMSDIENLCDRLIVINSGKKVCDEKIEVLKRDTEKCLIVKLQKGYIRKYIEEQLSGYSIADQSEVLDLIKIHNITEREEQDILRRLVANILIEEVYWNKEDLTQLYLKMIEA